MEITYTLEQINDAAEQIYHILKKNPHLKIIVFDGAMGSGKTTLIKHLCSFLGVVDEVTSPTFAIINEYATENYDFIYHFDFYRLKDISEATNIGTEDYLYSGNYCFIEWYKIIEPILPDNTLIIKIKETSTNQRTLIIEKINSNEASNFN